MIRPDPGEQVIARRDRSAGPLLAGIVLTAMLAMAIYAVATWALTGAVHMVGLLHFLAVFSGFNAIAHLLVRRRLDYCLTDRRLLIAPDRVIPLDEIRSFDVGAHSLTVKTCDRDHRIVALASPAWLATRLNRCRAATAPDTGQVAA
ncbi:hypothetical protein [Pseudooceanicola onchidii]|uniref:hypothetical protein n=1 Tax=Pseudooceanicola onchidii TaxID=2562279 RepID=UPI0010AAEC28|nr:hypothetical protein [Pseudooceanicola onchidii]